MEWRRKDRLIGDRRKRDRLRPDLRSAQYKTDAVVVGIGDEEVARAVQCN